MPSITPLGKRWEFLHSFWLLWLLFIYKHGNLTFMAFFYIGIRARQWKWVLSGCIYFIVVLAFVLVKRMGYVEHPIFDVTLGFMLFFYITSWVHAFWARKEYLQIIAQRKLEKERKIVQQKRKEDDKKIEQAISSGRQQHGLTVKNMQRKEPIYINTASKREIATITGKEVAKEIIRARKKYGRFTSVIDLIRVVELKPHRFAEMKKYFMFDDDLLEANDQQTASKQGRGRMVDY